MQRQRGEIGDADDEDEKRAGREIAVAEKRRPHKGLVRGEGMDEKQIERRGGDDRFDEDFAGTKPVELLAAVEQDLQRADGEAQGTEAEPVQLRTGVSLRLRQEGDDAEEGEDADRQVDVENPAPGVVLGQPATEHRPQDGTDHDRDAPHRHRRALALLRIDVEQHGLRQRDERRAEHALQDAEQHDLHQRLRHAAQHGGDGEAGDGDEEQALAPEPAGEEAGRRRHDRGGDDVGGQHPVDLVLAGRDAALDVGQRDVGDRRVERLHDGGEDHADGDRRAIGRPLPRASAAITTPAGRDRTARSGSAASRAHARYRHRPRRSFRRATAAGSCRSYRGARASGCAARP